ncbi:MAG: ABC transporter substrate-binding protein [Sulfolobales archaeon]
MSLSKLLLRGIGRSLLIAIVITVIIVTVAGVWLYYFYNRPTVTVSEIRVGFVQPLSGSLATIGKYNLYGAEMAVDEINSQGGVKSLGGAKIRLIIGDSAGDPSTAAREAERLIEVEKVVAVVGAYASSNTKTVSEVCERLQTPCLNGDSSSPILTRRGLKWFFRTTADDDLFAKQHIEFLKYINTTYPGSIGAIAILYEDSEFGSATADAWKKYATEAGFKIVEIISFRTGTPTLDAEITRLKQANPDVLLVAGYLTDAILIQKTMKRLDFNPKIVLAQDAGYIHPNFLKELGPLAYYVFSREVFNWDLFEKIPKIKEINDRFKAKYGVDMDGSIVRNYVVMWVLYYALEDAGKKASPTDLQRFRQVLRDSIAALDIGKDVLPVPWDGVKFDETGQNIRAKGIIVQVMPDDGKYHTVWPKEYATRDFIFPTPKWSERPTS